VSDLRRQNQERRLAQSRPDLFRRLVFFIERHWKKFTALLTIGLGDLLKHFVAGKIVDWTVNSLGAFGVWILDYPVAFLSMAVACVFLWLVGVAIRESIRTNASEILDHEGKPFQFRSLSPKWTAGFSTVVILCLLFLGYGAYEYYTTPIIEV
jgi:hypothetical protein